MFKNITDYQQQIDNNMLPKYAADKKQKTSKRLKLNIRFIADSLRRCSICV
ncbi:MAG: hypothetical protein LBQ66_14575 [Planctomycetaceae bacterium]|nr:hypothetical protein [Planctomycetaceae bacterium]